MLTQLYLVFIQNLSMNFLLPGSRYQTDEGSGGANDDEDGDSDEFIQSKGTMNDWKYILVELCMAREYTKADALLL